MTGNQLKCFAAALVCALSTASLTACAPTAEQAASPAAAETSPATECVIIDTDFDIDDMMAIPPVIGGKKVAAIIATEGYARAPEGAAAMEVFLANTPTALKPPVIEGAAYPGEVNFEKMPWIPTLRDSMERVNGLLTVPLQPAKNEVSFSQAITQAVDECQSVDVLIIGPFTSFVSYSPEISTKIDEVVMQGKPLQGDPTQREGNVSFNCEFDLPACESAFEQLKNYTATWVDVPRGTDPPYSPSAEMVEGLIETGLPGTLKAALNATPANWRLDLLTNGNKSLLWDQSAALFMLYPDRYQPVGGHWETTMTPLEFQTQWTADVNATAK